MGRVPRWVRLQQEMAARYPDSTRIFTGSRFHNIHLSRPDLIAAAVQDQLAATKPRSTGN